tara:strand:+ start:149447 stop:149590 length:144 start_codon:yes stop_codon:yes gene_type:complete
MRSGETGVADPGWLWPGPQPDWLDTARRKPCRPGTPTRAAVCSYRVG